VSDDASHVPPDLSDWEVLAGWCKRDGVKLTPTEFNLLCMHISLEPGFRRWTDNKLTERAKALFDRAYVWIDPLGPLPTE